MGQNLLFIIQGLRDYIPSILCLRVTTNHIQVTAINAGLFGLVIAIYAEGASIVAP